MRYVFNQWENGETSTTRAITLTSDIALTAIYKQPTFRLTFDSSPVKVQASVNNTPVNAGEAVDFPEGTQVVIIVPNEVGV